MPTQKNGHGQLAAVLYIRLAFLQAIICVAVVTPAGINDFSRWVKDLKAVDLTSDVLVKFFDFAFQAPQSLLSNLGCADLVAKLLDSSFLGAVDHADLAAVPRAGKASGVDRDA